MEGIIIVFRLPKGSKINQINQFCKKFYGQDTSSWKGKYHYHRRGLLDDIPHKKLIRGVIIIEEKYLEPVKKFLEEYNATVFIRKIILTAEDEKELKNQIK
ncbi:MAG: hypothetical protein ACP5H0_07945 [Caldisericum sp.]|uniref:hypothetical protein n=1 Tax=Caldisericum sp. TaxID=2499687 RepID=UPI003D0A881A